jgi:hypothetical protein
MHTLNTLVAEIITRQNKSTVHEVKFLKLILRNNIRDDILACPEAFTLTKLIETHLG